MTRTNDWNRGIIEEFRANEGRVGGRFRGRTLLLLHHRGARTGTWRINPLAYQALEGGGYALFASKGGSPTNPDWYHNLVANPRAKVEVGTETIDVVARIARGQERERIWTRQTQEIPIFAEYQERAGREIPVVILEPAEPDRSGD